MQLFLAHRHAGSILTQVHRLRRRSCGCFVDLTLVASSFLTQSLGIAFDLPRWHLDATEFLEQAGAFLEADAGAHGPDHPQHAGRQVAALNAQRAISRKKPLIAIRTMIVSALQVKLRQRAHDGARAAPCEPRQTATCTRQARTRMVTVIAIQKPLKGARCQAQCVIAQPRFDGFEVDLVGAAATDQSGDFGNNRRLELVFEPFFLASSEATTGRASDASHKASLTSTSSWVN